METLDGQSPNHVIITANPHYTLRIPITVLMLLYINFVVSLSHLECYVHPSGVPPSCKIKIGSFLFLYLN